jgi:tetratricopeptide (TPR) repeat protein
LFEKYKQLKNLIGLTPPPPPRNFLADGLAFFEAHKPTEALPLLEEGLLERPDHVAALLAVGRIHLDARRYDQAENALKRAHAFDTKNAKAHYMLGEVSQALQDALAAENHYRKATQLDPDFTDAFIRYGILLWESKRPNDAIKALERAIFLDRTALLARFHLAQICRQQGDHQRALTQLHMIKEREPSYSPVYQARAEIFLELGDNRQAIEEFQQLINLGAADAGVYWKLAQAHGALAQKDKALRAYLQVTRLNPQYWPAYYQAALLQEEAKQYQSAHQSFTLLLDIAPYQEAARAAVTRLAKLITEMATAMGNVSAATMPLQPGTAPLQSPATRPLGSEP